MGGKLGPIFARAGHEVIEGQSVPGRRDLVLQSLKPTAWPRQDRAGRAGNRKGIGGQLRVDNIEQFTR